MCAKAVSAPGASCSPAAYARTSTRRRGLARGESSEVDLIGELSADSVVAIEIKATAAPGPSDARHLVWLRDRLGERFLAGAVLHTGPQPFQLNERIFALPICTLWG